MKASKYVQATATVAVLTPISSTFSGPMGAAHFSYGDVFNRAATVAVENVGATVFVGGFVLGLCLTSIQTNI